MPNLLIKNRSGKVLATLFVIIAILLVTLTAICLYLFQKEIDRRKSVETKLEASLSSEARLTAQLDSIQKEKFLLEEKNKELDEKVNDLTGEVELEQGISKQLKSELSLLKEQVGKETEKNQKLEDQLKRLADLEQENITFRSQFEEVRTAKDDLEKKARGLEEKNQDLISKIADLEQTIQDYVERGVQAVQNVISAPPSPALRSSSANESVGLDKIVISNRSASSAQAVGLDKIVISDQIPSAAQGLGRVLTVDTETHFVIVSLGSQNGLSQGSKLSVYRAGDYLGDIRVTQLQDDMAAADFVPPLTSRLVRKDDQVVLKR